VGSCRIADRPPTSYFCFATHLPLHSHPSMALFLGLRLAECINRSVTPYEPPPARTTLGKRLQLRSQLLSRGPTVVAVVFVWASIACTLLCITGIALIVIASSAPRHDGPSTGAVVSAFIPTIAATLLVVSICVEVCIESGCCCYPVCCHRRGVTAVQSMSIEMDTLTAGDFQSTTSSNGGADG